MDIKYYDIGLNLFCRQFKEPEKIISDAAQEGIICILTGSDMKENKLVCGFVKDHNAYGSAGIHPHNADSAREKDFETIERIIKSEPKIVAVGECGLDYDRMFSTKQNQITCLEKHIELAEKLDMPMFLHERDAGGDFAKIFSRHPKICRKSVVHCFTGDRKTAEKYIEMGFYIGITGWICDDRRAQSLRDAVSAVPLDRLLLETDAPYLTPRNVRGLDRTNVPQNIRYVAAETAKYKGCSTEDLIRCAKENTERLFGIGS